MFTKLTNIRVSSSACLLAAITLLAAMVLLGVSLSQNARAAADLPPGHAAITSLPPETLSAGGNHTCGLKSDGSLACWGAGTINTGEHPHYGQASPPAGTFSQVSAGGYHTCGVKSDGSLACWGNDVFGQASPPAGTFSQVSAGGYHTCGLRSDGGLACWGLNEDNQASPPAGTFSQVSAGWDYTCGVKSDGSLACWGYNVFGQASPPAGTFSQVSAGTLHTCGLKSDGTLACWGWNYDNQASPPPGAFNQVSAGGYHTCGLKSDGSLACWGYDVFGQASPPTGTFSQVRAGLWHICGLRSDGSLECWGDNYFGQAPRLSLALDSLPAGGQGLDYSVPFSASGGTEPYTYKVIAGSLPPGLDLDPDGLLSGTPTASGVFTFTIQAKDSSEGFRLSTQASYSLAINTRPVLDPIGDQTVTTGQLLAFTVSANDPDPGQTLTFSMTGLPGAASFDPLTGEFAWTPAEEDGLGVFALTVTVTDDGDPALFASETFTITVISPEQRLFLPLITR